MSPENVEIVRRIYEQEMFGRDPGRLLELATPDIEYVNPPDAIEPGRTVGIQPAERSDSLMLTKLGSHVRHNLVG